MTDVYDEILDRGDFAVPGERKHVGQELDVGGGVYGEILDRHQEKQEKLLKASLDLAVPKNPDTQGKAKQLSKKTGLSLELVERNLEAVEQRQRVLELQSMLADSPVLARQMADPEFAALAYDDAEPLGAVERAAQIAKNIGRSGYASLFTASEGVTGVAQAAFEMPAPLLDPLVGRVFPENPLSRVSDALSGFRRQQRSHAERWMPEADGLVESAFYSGISSIAHNLLVMPLAFFPGGQSAALVGMSAPMGGVGYGMARDAGRDPGSAGLYGSVYGMTEYVFNRLPLHTLMKGFKEGASLRRAVVQQMALELPREQVIDFIESLADWAALNPDKTIQDFAAEFPERAAHVAIATAVGTAGQTTAMHGLNRMVTRNDQKAEQANTAAEMLAEINRAAAASKLLKRSPETFEEFVESALEEGSDVQNIYLDGGMLMQSGLAEPLSEISPSVADQVQQAAETGTMVSVPISEYASTIAASEHADALLDHIKVDPDGFSRAEAREYQENQAQRLDEEFERLIAKEEAQDEIRASQERVKQVVLDELNRLGRFTEQKNELDATLIAARTAVRAAQLGMTPEQLFERQRLRFAAESIVDGGQIYTQDGQLRTDTEAFRNWFGDSKVVDDDGQPMVVYHGGTVTDTFDLAYSGSGSGRESGFFFTPDIRQARDYAGDGNIVEAYLSIRNPLMTDRQLSPEEVAQAKADGHDGYWLIEDGLIEESEIVAFEPTQIKSVHNQGTFDPSDPNIFHQQGSQPRGAYDPGANIIALLKGADLSTFLHEAGHYFFESDIELATDILTESRVFGEDVLSDGEQQVLDDVATLLDWHGIKGSIEDQLNAWHALDFEEKRAYHERTAESFERYLLEGKAPSIELHSYFQQFRAWLLNVYQSLKNFLERNPEAGELSDEVRGVFDRMLATNEEIQLAEQGRAMIPLFRTESDANAVGMTPEEFAAYQRQGMDSTQDAVEDLQAKGLRDMRWLHRARGREIKRLKKEAAELRSQMRMEARKQVLSQPVYKAWSFLTRRVEQQDRLPDDPTKSRSKEVDPALDSLFVAMAKLGGLNREEAVKEWGIEPKEMPDSGLFGRPVLRAKGGLSIDGMREALAELGYLMDDANNPNWNPNEFEDMFDAELRGDPQYAVQADFDAIGADFLPGGWVDVSALDAGRLDLQSLRDLGYSEEDISKLKSYRMTSSKGLHPDVVITRAGLGEFDSGDHLVQELLAAEPPKRAIESLTDLLMLERYGELATPEAIEQAADAAIHNEARARMVTTEANALAKATGKPKVLQSAAREAAQTMISRVKVRDLRPSLYSNAASRAGRAAEQSMRQGNIEQAAAQKRVQLVNTYAARAAHQAREEMDRHARYLNKFNREGTRKNVDVDYLDQIDKLLERFDLRRGQSLAEIDRRTSLAEWALAQDEAGIEADIPDYLIQEANRTHYKNLSVEEFRGLVESVKQIEHLGRMKNKLLTQKEKREFDAVIDELTEQVIEAAADQGRQAEKRRSAQSLVDRVAQAPDFRLNFIRLRDLFRVLDGDKADGPFWQYFMRELNDRVNWENSERARASEELTRILKPLFDQPQDRFRGKYYPELGMSLSREGLFAIALNMGNEGNMQRLLDGYGWTRDQVISATSRLTEAEWRAVQEVWDYIDSYRPQIAAKERRVRGAEPEWVEPQQIEVGTVEGRTITLKGGYYPVVYDRMASSRADNIDEAKRAENMIKGTNLRATTRRTFTKKRAAEVHDMPILLDMSGLYNGLNEVLHDLALNEWIIDANKFINSKRLQNVLRDHYGPEVERQIKRWIEDIAKGYVPSSDVAGRIFSRLRHNVSPALLGFSIRTILSMPFGLAQTVPVVGASWTMRGLTTFMRNPRQSIRDAMEMSNMLQNRVRTRFRDLAEVRNRISPEGRGRDTLIRFAYAGMLKTQMFADTVTWWGAYLKQREATPSDEQLAIDIADQAVVDSQSGGDIKDLPRIMRGSELGKMFTFASIYMGSSSSLAMTSQMSRGRAKFVADMMWLYIIQASSFALMMHALTPGADDDKWEPESMARRMASENLSYLMGSFVGIREFWPVVDAAINKRSFDYSGPAGLMAIGDMQGFMRQIKQGEIDMALYNATVDLAGALFGIPSAQIKRTSQGVKAIVEGETDGPVEAARALAFGFRRRW